jgi:hypothetical protein
MCTLAVLWMQTLRLKNDGSVFRKGRSSDSFMNAGAYAHKLQYLCRNPEV